MAPIVLGYDVKSREEIESFLQEEVDLINRRFFYAIKESFRKGHSDAIILQAFQLDFSITAKRKDWVNSLRHARKYFESVEEYETCTEVAGLIKLIIDDERNLEIQKLLK
jgi:hypothetical protein